MSANWGKNIELSVFGESHGRAIGINIRGLPRGFVLDMAEIDREMARRRPKKDGISTTRSESDRPEIISGILGNTLTGAPLCAIFRNENQNSKDYSILKDVMRPGHSDYPAFVRFDGFNDVRGGGTFSGRLTAPLVFAGAIAKQILSQMNIHIGAHIKSIYDVEDEKFDTEIDKDTLFKLTHSDFPLIDSKKEEEMKKAIFKAKEMGDSVGGRIECCAINTPVGMGNPFFDSVESVLSHLLFSIPAVKGVEFGSGFDMCRMYGSESNDPYYYDENGCVKTKTNHNGGVLGGLFNGMPLTFTVAVKPTPSISKGQDTINLKTGENTTLSLTGRHDACIVPRAVPVVEAVCALAILEIL